MKSVHIQLINNLNNILISYGGYNIIITNKPTGNTGYTINLAMPETNKTELLSDEVTTIHNAIGVILASLDIN